MTTTAFTQEQIMLTLACCSYLGFDLPPSPVKERQMHEQVNEKLADLEPIKEGWELAWGPASYRAPLSLFDDSTMFVVRDRRRPARYVISIRGTNPVSWFDWVFGDFTVGRQLPWGYGNPAATGEARISYSTALGLNILQHLRAEPPNGGARRDGVRGIAKGLLGHQADALRAQLKQLRIQVDGALQGLGAKLDQVAEGSLDDRVRGLTAVWQPEKLSDLFSPFAAADGMMERGRLDLLRLIEGGVHLRSRFDRGEDLLSFLTRTVEEADDGLEILVTGHSKGGALSSTTALWLADTQGSADWIPQDERWDPGRKATVSCYSYAGPTAGNAAFAAHSNAVIGKRCHRIANTLDVVPLAWQADDILRVPGLYRPPVEAPAGMQHLADLIAGQTRDLGYTQIGNHVRLLHPRQNPNKKLYVTQLVHQHLQAYIDELGLGECMGQETFFRI